MARIEAEPMLKETRSARPALLNVKPSLTPRPAVHKVRIAVKGMTTGRAVGLPVRIHPGRGIQTQGRISAIPDANSVVPVQAPILDRLGHVFRLVHVG